MTGSQTKHVRSLHVAVYGPVGVDDDRLTLVDEFDVEGDAYDVKRELRNRRAERAGREVRVYGESSRGRREVARYGRTSPRGPWHRRAVS